MITQPWIPVLRQDGSQDELSLHEVFLHAADLRRIVGDLPTQEFALLRLLLAVAHDALDGPADIDAWAELWDDPACFAPVEAYLDRHRHRFDLLHPHTPFFQTTGLRTAADDVFSLNRIVADVPNNEPFLSARMPAVDRLTYAEAARWTVHAHAYDTSGIKTGAVGDDRVKGGKVYPLGVGWAGNLGGVFAEGANLRETLLLNLVAPDTPYLDPVTDGGAAADAPAWRRDPCGPGGAERPPTGVRDLYTWQSRRLRLHHDADGVYGVVLGYGDPLPSRNMHKREPMSLWRRSEAQEKKLRQPLVYLPREHDPSRSAWRGIAALVVGRGEPTRSGEPAKFLRPGVLEWISYLVTEGALPRTFPIRTRIVGAVYGTQQSVVDDIADDHLDLAVVLLHQQDRSYARQAEAAADEAEKAVIALGDLAGNLARATGSSEDGPRATARDLGFGALEIPYRHWLRELGQAEDPTESRSRWQRQVHDILSPLAGRLIADAGDNAWQGRTVPTRQGGTQWLNSALADRWFRAALNKCLAHPYARDDRDDAEDPDTSPAAARAPQARTPAPRNARASDAPTPA
ncbi:type I-E CRISPR-associated protein Cse1/CasA [Streptomyces sp. NPDC047097]|uniref:type I-E CRISPR-associated protein Cse1/CasA n=1 Tax=Streptomyces sp. NPDC047097 TaxID=3155260 RepID=UPI0033F2F625